MQADSRCGHTVVMGWVSLFFDSMGLLSVAMCVKTALIPLVVVTWYVESIASHGRNIFAKPPSPKVPTRALQRKQQAPRLSRSNPTCHEAIDLAREFRIAAEMYS